MREFVYGTKKQYKLLEDSLEDELCHVYEACALPNGCSRDRARIGFEKEGLNYAVFIDKGITFNGKAPAFFKNWLRDGTVRFVEFKDVKKFFTSLKCLY